MAVSATIDARKPSGVSPASLSADMFHMAVAYAGKNTYLASFYERLLNHGQRMLHLHFEYLERTGDGYLLKRIAIFQIRSLRFRPLIFRMSWPQNRCTLLRDML